jgi:hypothetical protein
MAVVFHDQNLALCTNARVDNRDMNSAGGELLIGTANPETGLGWPLRPKSVVMVITPDGGGMALLQFSSVACYQAVDGSAG